MEAFVAPLLALPGLPSLPAWWPWGNESYEVTRFLLRRGLAFVYLVAFLVAARQFRPLAGEDGLLPIERYVEYADFRDRPSLFYFFPDDRVIGAAAWLGVALSLLALLGVPSALGLGATVAVWGVLWLLYQSFVNAGQTFYGFGWESMLLEAGFLAIFLGSAGHATPEPVVWLFRWLLFRNMLGAGLIKWRGDDCWRDLTCMDYHYETQPMPNPLSWYVHHLPDRFHRLEVLSNHVVELAIPFLYFAPQPVAAIAGAATVAFQAWLILTGNFSWLNWLTAVLAVSTFADATLAWLPMAAVTDVMTAPAATGPVPPALWVAVALLVAVVLVLSYWPARNLLSSRQAMNTSFDPLHLVNTYGAFGSITRTRHEIVVRGTDDDPRDPDAKWETYEFPGKPTDPEKRPPQIAPYHHRLGWQLWFAAMSGPRRNPWFRRLLTKLLDGDEGAKRLLATDPFPDDPPRYVSADLYRYRYTTPEERRETGRWWHRERVDTYLGPLSRERRGRASFDRETGER